MWLTRVIIFSMNLNEFILRIKTWIKFLFSRLDRFSRIVPDKQISNDLERKIYSTLFLHVLHYHLVNHMLLNARTFLLLTAIKLHPRRKRRPPSEFNNCQETIVPSSSHRVPAKGDVIIIVIQKESSASSVSINGTLS